MTNQRAEATALFNLAQSAFHLALGYRPSQDELAQHMGYADRGGPLKKPIGATQIVEAADRYSVDYQPILDLLVDHMRPANPPMDDPPARRSAITRIAPAHKAAARSRIQRPRPS